MDVDAFIRKEFVYAIVGASNDGQKYGFKVTKDLKEAGYDVVPVNPKGEEILGLRTATGLAAIGRRIDVVVFVVPPSVAVSVLREVLALGVTNKVWFQPGSESADALKFCADNGVAAMSGLCIMVSRL